MARKRKEAHVIITMHGNYTHILLLSKTRQYSKNKHTG